MRPTPLPRIRACRSRFFACCSLPPRGRWYFPQEEADSSQFTHRPQGIQFDAFS
jgi:hypothetical protein